MDSSKSSRAWHSLLDKYLKQQRFIKGNVAINIYVKLDRDNILIIEVYVHDIIFGRDDDMLSKNFSKVTGLA